MTEIRWTGRSDASIAEAAEALHVDTDMIMAVQSHPEHTLVFYTPTYTEGVEPEVWAASLRRRHDGVLVVTEKAEQPGMWRQLMARMEGE
jgi:hypothetical protein